MSVSAAWSMTFLPVSVEPVNMMKSTSSISAAPVSPRPVATWKTSSGSPHSSQHLLHQQRGQRGDLGGLEHGGVAGGQRRDAVAEGVGQREVPRPDHADDAERAVVDEELGALDEQVGGTDLLVGQVLGRVLGPEAERGGGVVDLGELGVLVGLARLRADHVDDAVGVVRDPLLGAQEDLGAALEAQRLPAGLRRAGAGDDLLDLVRGHVRDGRDDLAGGRVLDGNAVLRPVLGRGGTLLNGCHVPSFPPRSLRC